METVAIKVESLLIGSLVDLESCPFLKTHPSATMEFASVAHVERETADCVVIGYEGIDHVGYPVGTVLQGREALDPVVNVRPVGQPDEWVEWKISQNLTDRWGEINDHDKANKPLALLEANPELLERLRAQMWDECTFIVRKDGKFGLLYEVEFTSIESEDHERALDAEYLKTLKPHEAVVTALKAAMLPLVTQYPGVLFAVPADKEIVNDRPAAWAFVPDGLLNEEQRKNLGMTLLNL